MMWEKEDKEANRIIEQMVQNGKIKSLIKSLRLPWGKHGVINRMIRQGSAKALVSISEVDPERIRSTRFLFSSATARLVKDLTNYDDVVRKDVARVLENMKWKPTSEAERVLCLLAKEDFEQIVTVGGPAVEAFVRWSREPGISPTGRATAVKAALALSEIGDTRVVELLLKMIVYPNSMEETAPIVKALAKLTRSDITPICKEFERTLVTTELRVKLGWVLCEAGNKNAVVPFLDWLHQYANDSSGAFQKTGCLSDIVRETIPMKALENLFGVYTDMVLDLFVVTPSLPLEVDLSRHTKAVMKLCAIKTPVSSNLLHKVAMKNRIQLSYTAKWSGPMLKEKIEYVDVHRISALAKDEMALRGQPPYDPKAYLQL